jgi:para-nitrobenzyl esterase
LRSAADAARIGERYAAMLNIEPTDAEAFRRVDVAALLAAQGELARSLRPAALGYGDPPFGPVIDDRTMLPASEAWGHARGTGIDVIIGSTRDEQAAQFFVDPAVQTATADQAAEVVSHFAHGQAGAVLDHYRQLRLGATPAELLSDFYTDIMFRLPALRLAEQRAAVSLQSWVYQFDWASPAGFGSCHCIELPFVFGSLAGYQDAPMLRGVDPKAFQALSVRIQDAWLGFARKGSPSTDHGTAWPPYTPPERSTMKFDTHVVAAQDPAGYAAHPARIVAL